MVFGCGVCLSSVKWNIEFLNFKNVSPNLTAATSEFQICAQSAARQTFVPFVLISDKRPGFLIPSPSTLTVKVTHV